MTEFNEPDRPEALAIDKNLFEVRFHGTRIQLTATEFDLLDALDSAADRVVPRSELLRKVWSDSSTGARVVDTFVSRLRAKLRLAGHPGIASVRKRGYRLLSPPEEIRAAPPTERAV